MGWWVVKKMFYVICEQPLISFSISETYVENQPTSFRMVEERSLNGSPRVEVTFSDGYTDTMVLNKHYATEEDRMAGTEGWGAFECKTFNCYTCPVSSKRAFSPSTVIF